VGVGLGVSLGVIAFVIGILIFLCQKRRGTNVERESGDSEPAGVTELDAKYTAMAPQLLPPEAVHQLY
jgi:hypothetical protein